MSFDVEEAVLYQIGNASVLPYPYPHFYVRNVFPQHFYEALISHLPPLSAYTRMDETGKVSKGHYQERFIAGLEEFEELESMQPGNDAFWRELASWLMGERFSQLILQKFSQTIDARFGPRSRLGIESETRFVRDFTNYAIPPHTDSPRKLVSLLFYLPRDESLAEMGTSIYQPLDPQFTCDGTRHHQFKHFKKVTTAEFLPNSLFAFVKTPNAFHGVEPIKAEDVERDLMLYNIYVNKVVKPSPKRSALLGFWKKRSNAMALLGKLRGANVEAFVKELTADLAKRYPPTLDQSAEKKISPNRLTKVLEDTFTKAVAFKTENSLGAFGKAKLGNCFRWELKDLGYTDEFIEVATEGLVVYITRKAPPAEPVAK